MVGFTATAPDSPFVIDPAAQCMATFTGTRLDIPVEAAAPPTAVWQFLTADPCEELDGRSDPIDWPAYPDLLPR